MNRSNEALPSTELISVKVYLLSCELQTFHKLKTSVQHHVTDSAHL